MKITDPVAVYVVEMLEIGGQLGAIVEKPSGQEWIRSFRARSRVSSMAVARVVSAGSVSHVKSGAGAPAFLPGAGDWVWEDLQATASHPISGYRVHRLEGAGSGPFECVFQGPTPVWPGGDPQIPLTGELFSYLVVADNSTGDQTSPGTGTGGTPRTLSAAACP